MSFFYNLIYGTKDKIIEDKTNEINSLRIQLDKFNPTPKEEYYNNKYPTFPIFYKRTDKLGTISIDVRQFINPNNSILPTINGSSDDEKALNCLGWVIKNVKYTPDKTQYGLDEYWAFAYETQNYGKGDCEDGTILLANIMLTNKIPDWKIRVSAGNVLNPYTKTIEGHCYVTYYCEDSDKWVVLDWCYLPNGLDIKNRIDYKEESNYKDVWFSFNKEYSWSKGLNTNAEEILN